MHIGRNLQAKLGLAPTPQQAVAMAEHIYNYDMSYLQEKRTVEDWRLITVREGREGLKMVYIPSDDDWQISLYQSIQNHLMDAVKSELREAEY